MDAVARRMDARSPDLLRPDGRGLSAARHLAVEAPPSPTPVLHHQLLRLPQATLLLAQAPRLPPPRPPPNQVNDEEDDDEYDFRLRVRCYSTSCLVLQELYNITAAFVHYRNMVGFENIVATMEVKFKKYWEPIPPIFALASVMDPRMKLENTEIFVNEIAKNLQVTPSLAISDVKKMLIVMYNKYEVIYGKFTSSSPSLEVPTARDSNPASQLLSRLGKQKSVSSSSNSQLNQYLSTDYELEYEGKFDILDWWKLHATKLPVLSIMARDLLTPPVSTVASESAFSSSGKIVDELRSCLSEESLECLMCLKDWEAARNRTQNGSLELDEFMKYYSNLDSEDGTCSQVVDLSHD